MGMAERVLALENKLYVDDDEQPEGVFIYRIDAKKNAPPPEPVKGWRYGEHRIMRAENETDKELNKRVIAEVKSSLGKNVVPVFHSINEAEEIIDL